jgi:peptide/nickel transport system substrate-binding protein
LAANENYYKGRPAIDEVVFYHIHRREKSWTCLIAGDTDIVGNLTVKNYEIIRQYADLFYFAKYFYNYYSILLYNTHHPLFENPMVRRALTHAINREYIVSDMLNGFAEIVAGPVDNRSAWHDPKLEPLSYDPHLALEYLKKAGWTLDPDTQCQVKDGQMFEFDLLLPKGSETDARVARYIKLNLNEIGIRVHQKGLPLDELNKRYYQNTRFDAVMIELNSNVRRLEEIIGLWVTPDDAVSIAGGFDSPDVSSIGNLAINAKDPAMKRAHLQHFDHLIADLQPGSFLFRKMSIDVISKRFELKYPFSFDHEGFYRLQFARLKNDN